MSCKSVSVYGYSGCGATGVESITGTVSFSKEHYWKDAEGPRG